VVLLLFTVALKDAIIVEPSARRNHTSREQGEKRKETNSKVFAEEVVGDSFETAKDLARVIDLRY
jgi:hypothetical protein